MQRLLDEDQVIRRQKLSQFRISPERFPETAKISQFPKLLVPVQGLEAGGIRGRIAAEFDVEILQPVGLLARLQRLGQTIRHSIHLGNLGVGQRVGQPHGMANQQG